MIGRETIKAAKAVDMGIIFDEFNWGERQVWQNQMPTP